MMLITSLFVTLIVSTLAQRPFYAPRQPIVGVHSRFKDQNSSTTTSTPDLADRLGEGASTTTPKIPVDARGDVELVNKLNTWPRETRPFWLLNAEHIEQHRGQPATRVSGTNGSTLRLRSHPGSDGSRIDGGSNRSLDRQ